MNSWYVGECECGQGSLFISKDKRTEKLVLICEDCCLVWSDFESFNSRKSPISTRFDMDIEDSVSKEEIIKAGWGKYVKNLDNPIDI